MALISLAAACGANGEEALTLTAVGLEIGEISDPSPSAHADVSIQLGVPQHNPKIAAVDISVPPGWDLAPASTIPVGDTIGSGALHLDTGCDGGPPDSFPFILHSTVPAGQEKALWSAELQGQAPLQFFVTGNPEDGHTISLNLLVEGDVARGCPELLFGLLLLGRSSSGTTLLTNPGEAGDYTWRADLFTVPSAAEPAGQASDIVTIGEEGVRGSSLPGS